MLKKIKYILFAIFVCHAAFAETCNPGYGLNDAGECEKCSAGTYSVGGEGAVCIRCAAGTYSNAIGASNDHVCKTCPAGSCCAYGQKYSCIKGTFAGSGQSCKKITNSVQEVQVCYNTRGDGMCTVQYMDLSVYQKGVFNPCPSGCTTEGVSSISSNDCTVKTAQKFCINKNNDATCFSWPKDGSISEQNLSNSVVSNIACPR